MYMQWITTSYGEPNSLVGRQPARTCFIQNLICYLPPRRSVRSYPHRYLQGQMFTVTTLRVWGALVGLPSWDVSGRREVSTHMLKILLGQHIASCREADSGSR